MAQNLYSLGLLRNGKVYANKEIAYKALTGATTNDGVAKLSRYLDTVSGNTTVIRTLVGFYANASEMTEASGGTSYYTVLDVEGNAAEVERIKEEITVINNIIGDGIDGETLTDAINDINDKIGTGFSENFTVADALAELADELTEALTITLKASDDPDYAKVYTLKQGGNLIGTINIPKDIVVKEGKLVHGYWSGDTFTEDEEGPDIAIKLVLNNDEVIYINAKDLVDVYTGGDGITMNDNEISINIDGTSEAFLTVGPDGLKLDGVQAAIDAKADEERLDGGDGINIISKKINAVAAEYSAPGVNNPITVDEDGIKFASTLDCGFFDN